MDVTGRNLFETASLLIKHLSQGEDLRPLVKQGIDNVNARYTAILDQIEDELKRPLQLSPPFQWAQSLHNIELEIKYAYRHDVAGCADLFNETLAITKDTFSYGASCKELDRSMHYLLEFRLWDEIDTDTVKVERQPAGKVAITMQKLLAPARWRQLYLEDSPKP